MASLESVKVECNAKINLYLRVVGRRDDGFHNIQTIYHSISLHDTLTITPRKEGFSVSSDNTTMPRDMTNLALKAAARILNGRCRGVNVVIEKRIPMGAGLGGASADAAGALMGINKLFGLGYSLEELEAVAAGLGSDVKFMLHGGCAIGRGRGDDLTALPSLPSLPLLLVIPPMTISTGWAYDSLKIGLTRGQGELTMIMNALGKGDVTSLCNLLENDFESLIFDRFPLVRQIKEDLLGCGAMGALMSGSGPVVYGLFSEAGDAEACRERLSTKGVTALVSTLAEHSVTVSM